MSRRLSTAGRLEDFMRMASPALTNSVRHGVELDALKDSLARHESAVREGFAEVLEAVRETAELQRKTNGRVTDLEMKNVAKDAAREATAKIVEEVREQREQEVTLSTTREAIKVARGSWIRPGVMSATVAGVLLGADKLLG